MNTELDRVLQRFVDLLFSEPALIAFLFVVYVFIGGLLLRNPRNRRTLRRLLQTIFYTEVRRTPSGLHDSDRDQIMERLDRLEAEINKGVLRKGKEDVDLAIDDYVSGQLPISIEKKYAELVDNKDLVIDRIDGNTRDVVDNFSGLSP